MTKPRILVGCPTNELYSYCLDEFLDGIKSISYTNYDFVMVDNSESDEHSEKLKSAGIKVIKDNYMEKARDRIISSRNLIRKYMIDNDYDYLLMMDQDVVPPSNIIEKLLEYDKDVMSAVVFNHVDYNGKKIYVPLLLISKDANSEKARYMQIDELKPARLARIKAAGCGCLLIKKNVLKDIKFRYVHGKKGFEDVWFGLDVMKAGYEMYADTGIECKHLIEDRKFKLEI